MGELINKDSNSSKDVQLITTITEKPDDNHTEKISISLKESPNSVKVYGYANTDLLKILNDDSKLHFSLQHEFNIERVLYTNKMKSGEQHNDKKEVL